MMTTEQTTSQPELYTRIASELSLRAEQVERTVVLLLDDATVPFIARYRKEVTGNLDEEQIRQVAARHKYYQELAQRRETVLKTIEEQGKLTDELRQQLLDCYDRTELEDLYLPYRPKRQTKATMAIERGLEPLAQLLWAQEAGRDEIDTLAASLVDAEKGVPSAEEALAGAGHIMAEWIADRADLRKALRAMMLNEGAMRSTVVKAKAEEKTKFQDYYDFNESVTTIPSHRTLAILRGAREGVLSVAIDIDHDKALTYMRTQIVTQPDAATADHLQAAVEDAYQRLILPSLQNEVRGTLKSRADAEAIGVFQENLSSLLMSPPLGAANIIGLDPGLRTGCKLSLVDETGKYLEDTAIYPLAPRNDVEGAEQVLQDILSRHTVKAIAVGNGTGSREATSFVRQFLRKIGRQQDIACVVVNEAGASVYSASKVAREEFPKLDVTVRGAISIARRLQDPLAELVKIDPKSIGVGQYQHDVDQKPLRLSLSETVESCVNRVGVDVNTASAELLQYVSGLNMRQARNMVSHRNEHGRFENRQDFLNVNGIGEKAFQQATGFLRIKDGANVLDSTAVHPESYPVVEEMAQSLNVPVSALVANAELINSLDLEQFVNEQAGLLTLEDIREELLKPGRDPRDAFVTAKFRDDVTEIAHLEEGMMLEGVVSNVTNFGAFVDIGVHQDGLVHISELSQRFVRDPREVVHVGQVVQVRVLSVDQALQRISLSMKIQAPRPAQAPQPARKRAPSATTRRRRKRASAARATAPPRAAETPQREAEPEPELTMEEKLRALQTRFRQVDKG
ncbi:Tex family protein [Candidatus Entotheonella palauensis]|uniref:RNA-binding protein n=1 Tax=Candidatus Entotheonella gemina TaxID=1429439 RepID=W4M5B0_9BACT|nr:Tex family protein [Candidatus Entotheonella palauensis]ETX05385.1 MAG: RNA-binding protein [Candidatus Entotheonella gemina]